MRAARNFPLTLLAAVAVLAWGEDFDAKQTFATRCAMCHGKDGAPSALYAQKGVKAFKDSEWQKAKSDADIKKAIVEGRKGTMMASFKQAFSDEEIDALVKYIRTLAPSTP